MKTIDDIMQEIFCDVSDEELLRNPNRADFHNMTVKDEETLGQFMDRYGLGNCDLKRVLASGMVCKQLHFDKFLAHGAPDDDVVDLAMQYAVSRFVRLSMRRSYTCNAEQEATEKEMRFLTTAFVILNVRTPKKPLPEERYYGNGKCPCCNAVFLDKATRFCGNCGQALDWGACDL